MVEGEAPPGPPRPSGSRPQALQWPFELARIALQAMRAQLDELASCSTSHDHAAGGLLSLWFGSSCQRFGSRVGQGLSSMASDRVQLAGDIAELQAAVVRAEAARQARQAAMGAWDRQMDAYRRHQALQRQLG